MELKTYPKFMNHVDHNEPVRVDSKAEQTDMENKGWTTARIFKEYPKWVEGKIVHSRAEEDRLLAERKPLPDATPDAVEQGPASTEEIPSPADSLFAEGLFVTQGQDPEVIKETQVEGQDTAKVVEKPKKSPGKPKKK